ncbi:(2Fe-2S)-binding protein [Cellulophaga lytica]|uniref:Rieske 2Fe-2S domain-containing protein n=1 Tax=Cellulophaga lytica TaxID=979 RepID=UPI0009503855|nr:Rieske 2Fe-2S domain-containing protein [Cellulophaga lytica]APU09113.1 (2Fe-2S)-binding protein [Cellulophaga lytica]
MERKQFLRTLGAGAAFALTFPCLGGCSKDEDGGGVKEPENIDFTIDLESEEGLKLTEKGGYILRKKELVVVAKNLEGNFVAVSRICGHEGYAQVKFESREGGIFRCDVHGEGSKYNQQGEPLNQVDKNKTTKPIKVYQTALTGTMLRIFE